MEVQARGQERIALGCGGRAAGKAPAQQTALRRAACWLRWLRGVPRLHARLCPAPCPMPALSNAGTPYLEHLCVRCGAPLKRHKHGVVVHHAKLSGLDLQEGATGGDGRGKAGRGAGVGGCGQAAGAGAWQAAAHNQRVPRRQPGSAVACLPAALQPAHARRCLGRRPSGPGCSPHSPWGTGVQGRCRAGAVQGRATQGVSVYARQHRASDQPSAGGHSAHACSAEQGRGWERYRGQVGGDRAGSPRCRSAPRCAPAGGGEQGCERCVERLPAPRVQRAWPTYGWHCTLFRPTPPQPHWIRRGEAWWVSLPSTYPGWARGRDSAGATLRQKCSAWCRTVSSECSASAHPQQGDAHRSTHGRSPLHE